MKNKQRFLNFRIENKDYEYLRKRALANDRSVSYILRKIIKKVIKEQKEKK